MPNLEYKVDAISLKHFEIKIVSKAIPEDRPEDSIDMKLSETILDLSEDQHFSTDVSYRIYVKELGGVVYSLKSVYSVSLSYRNWDSQVIPENEFNAHLSSLAIIESHVFHRSLLLKNANDYGAKAFGIPAQNPDLGRLKELLISSQTTMESAESET